MKQQMQTNHIEWREIRLKEIAQFINGRAFKPSDWESNGKLIIRIQDLTGSITNPNYTTKTFEDKYLVRKGDLLISWSATLDAFIWSKEEGWLNQHIFKVVPDNKFVDKKYLYYFVKQTINLFLNETHGSTMKHITKGRFESIKILLPFSNGKPDLKEQERIVNILEGAEKLNERGKKIEILFDEYLKSIFYEMFLKEKGKFKEVSLGEVFEIARGGSPRPIQNYITKEKNGINWIRISDTKNNTKYIYQTEERIKPEGLKKTRLVQEGDFLLSNSMSFGRPYIMRTKGCIHDGWLVIRDVNKVTNNDYLYSILSSDYLYSQFLSSVAGTTVKNLKIEVVKKVKIPLPPLPLQQKFAKIVEQVEKMKESINKTKQKSEELFNSLVSKGFRGEL